MSWGSNMKRFAITALNLFISFAGTSAFAADMPVKAPPPPPRAATTWTGFYLGANGGWSGSTSQDSDAFIVPPQAGPNFHQSGGLAGVTYGHNWQFGHSWVLGFEGDFDFADINGSYTNPTLCGTASCFTRLKNFSTDRVRAGVDRRCRVWAGQRGAQSLYNAGRGVFQPAVHLQRNLACWLGCGCGRGED